MKSSPVSPALPAFVLIAMLFAPTALSVAEESAPVVKQESVEQPASTENLSEASSDTLPDPLPGNTIYKSVDAKGRVTYSDVPNPAAVQQEQVSLPSYSIPTNTALSQARLNDMAATTKRLQEDRRARENDRRRDEELQASARAAQYPQVIVQNRVYRPPSYRGRPEYPRVYPPYHYPSNHDSRHNRSSVGINISGGSSKFRYGVSLGNQQSHQRSRSIRTPYRSSDWERR
ncbi:MAG: DUF4124 domain-containing protein [Porticoccaceae bacterium]|nr:DUF4124 domain-containing protein [Porticoccaceae bacterium]